MKQISYSAPAKVILSGEHAVVYGKPALVSAINLRLRFSLFSPVSSRIQFGIPDKETNTVILMIAQKVKDYLKKEKVKFKDNNFTYTIKSEIPVGRGLGSSAALSVTAVAAFLEFYTGSSYKKEIINNLAFQAEMQFHKRPSGVDNSAATFGGLIFYRREFDFLKNISSLNFKISKKIEDGLFLIDTGKPRETTGKMVDEIGRDYNKKPQLIEQIFNDIEKTTKRMTVAVVKEDGDFFQQSIIDNEIFLEILGIVSPKAKTLLKKLEPYGVGKITGAGGKKTGSGYLLFYTNKQKELENYLMQHEINYYKFYQDHRGLQQANSNLSG